MRLLPSRGPTFSRVGTLRSVEYWSSHVKFFGGKTESSITNNQHYGDSEEGKLHCGFRHRFLNSNSTVKVALINGTSLRKKKDTEPELRSSSYNSIESMASLRRARFCWISAQHLDHGAKSLQKQCRPIA